MWNYIFNVIDVILKLGSPKRKTHKIHMINDPSKTFENICFGDKFFFWKTNKNCNSYGLMKIWSDLDHSKVPNYWMVKVFKEKIHDMSLSFYISSYIEFQ